MNYMLGFLTLMFCTLVIGQSAPPACMLACVNENSAGMTCNSLRLSCMCESSALSVIAPCLASKCASANAASATSYFQSQCADQGYNVQLHDVSPSDPSTGSGLSTKTSATGAATGSKTSSADKINIVSGGSGAILGLVGALVFGLFAI